MREIYHVGHPVSYVGWGRFYTRRMNKWAVAREFLGFLKERKKYWLLPIVAVFLLVGILLVAAQGSVVAPFIYTLF